MAHMNPDNDHRAPERPASTAGSTSAPAATSSAYVRTRHRVSGHRGLILFAIVLALLALAAAAYIGWRQWQQEQGSAADSHTVAEVQARVGTMEASVASLGSERALLRQRLSDTDQVNRSLREELLGQSSQLRDLDNAVAKLSEKSLSGHDTMLLDETESLLRMAQQRYALFHDAQAAATAYTLAEQSLAAVDDTAFVGLRQSIQAERDALLHSQPQTLAAELAGLQQLRSAFATLPLKANDAPAAAADQGAWARIGRALSGVISVQRDNAGPLAVADARLARELATLDLAQAQAELLANDTDAARAALQRVKVSLASQFNGNDAAVKQAQMALAALSADIKPATPVPLGAALVELRNLRAVHALKPAADQPAVAPSPRPATGRAPAKAASAGARP
jgi:uroporphyrin-3 C-methyltransferase